jgi:putative membrane protein
MGLGAFTGQTAKAEVAAAIRAIESATSAEVVVAVRPASGHYRHTDYLVGFAFAFAALIVFLFDPEHEFSLEWMPVDTLIAFAIGTVLSAGLSPVRRLLTSRKLMRSNARTASRGAFVDLGISRTSGRTGILVFVSTFERCIEVVPDIGVDMSVLGPGFADAVARLDAAVRRGPDFSKFVEALRLLGPVLAQALPRGADDVNELPDEPAT